MYFTDDDGYQNFLVFAPMFSSLVLDSNKKSSTRYRSEYHPKKVNHFMLALNRQCLI